MTSPNKAELQAIYANRFDHALKYRNEVWSTLCTNFWQHLVPADANVLDLGCGYGQFINQIRCARRWGMDLNPASRGYLNGDVTFLEQDCSERWNVPNESLDVVFTSNFFEHLPDKSTLTRTLTEAYRALRPNGQIIAMGPNIKCVPGKYWDFYDHYLPLTEKSLGEGMRAVGFMVEKQIARFLPYTMAEGPAFPQSLIALYVKVPIAWRFFGKQFLVVARKPAG